MTEKKEEEEILCCKYTCLYIYVCIEYAWLHWNAYIFEEGRRSWVQSIITYYILQMLWAITSVLRLFVKKDVIYA